MPLEWPRLIPIIDTETGSLKRSAPEDRRGLFKLPGKDYEITSAWPLGEEPHHWDCFCAYEMTFGRGKAKDVSHGYRGLSARQGGRETINDIRDEYRRFANQLGHMISRSTPEEARQFIEGLRAYREKYPQLYDDVPDPAAPNVPEQG
jgi:hypothetical protein